MTTFHGHVVFGPKGMRCDSRTARSSSSASADRPSPIRANARPARLRGPGMLRAETRAAMPAMTRARSHSLHASSRRSIWRERPDAGFRRARGRESGCESPGPPVFPSPPPRPADVIQDRGEVPSAEQSARVFGAKSRVHMARTDRFSDSASLACRAGQGDRAEMAACHRHVVSGPRACAGIPYGAEFFLGLGGPRRMSANARPVRLLRICGCSAELAQRCRR